MCICMCVYVRARVCVCRFGVHTYVFVCIYRYMHVHVISTLMMALLSAIISAFRGKKCESLRVQIHLPRGFQLNAHRAEVPLNSGVAIFCSCFGADYLTITDPEWIFREETLPLSDTLRRGFFLLSRTKIAVLRITQFTLDDVGTYVCGDYHLRHTLTLVLKEAGDLRG